MKIKAPRGETIWETINDTHSNPRFVITSKERRDFYFLYEVEEGGLKKLGRAKTPTDLEKKFDVMNAAGQT